MAIPIIVIIGGTWVTQDAIASVLYYIGKPEEKWYYNQACRVMRACWGITLIICGIVLIAGGNPK